MQKHKYLCAHFKEGCYWWRLQFVFSEDKDSPANTVQMKFLQHSSSVNWGLRIGVTSSVNWDLRIGVNSHPNILFLTYFCLTEFWLFYQNDVNFESNNSLKLSFANIWGIHLNFVYYETSSQSNTADILALCETNLDDSIDSGNFSLSGYFL